MSARSPSSAISRRSIAICSSIRSAIGLGAASLETRNRDRERVGRIPGLGALYRDQLVYAGAILQRFVESYVVDIKFDLECVIDGVVHSFESLLDVIVKNTKIFGGEWVFDPNTESDDGKFELVPVTGRRDFGTKLLGSLRRSPVGVDDLSSARLRARAADRGLDVRPRCSRGTALPAAQIDGEEIPAGDHYRIEVVPRALQPDRPPRACRPVGAERTCPLGVMPSVVCTERRAPGRGGVATMCARGVTRYATTARRLLLVIERSLATAVASECLLRFCP